MSFVHTEKNSPYFFIPIYFNKLTLLELSLLKLIYSILTIKALNLKHIINFKYIDLLYISFDINFEVAQLYNFIEKKNAYQVSYSITGPITTLNKDKDTYIKKWIIVKKDDSIEEYMKILRIYLDKLYSYEN